MTRTTQVNERVSHRRAQAGVESGSAKSIGRILIIEDERDVAELMRYHVMKEGYEATVASKGIDGIRLVKELRPDLILLDIMVPELNGWEICRRLKQDPETVGIPVVIVTGRVEEGDKVLGLEMGADDYVTKPFSPRELVARIRAVRRRSASARAGAQKTHLKAGPLELDRNRYEVTMNGHRVDLTRKEFELLATLLGTPGRVFSRDELLDLVWRNDAFVEPRTVDVHLARLRAKFLAAGLAAPEIETVRGVGYRLRESE